MMTWDIIDQTQPDIEITSRKKERRAFRAQVSSAVRTVVTGVIFASSSAVAVAQPFASASLGPQIQIQRSSETGSYVKYVRSGVTDGTDTQRGQSTIKLARTFASFFQPAAPEDDVDDEYCFG